MADSSRIDDLRRRVQKDPASIAFAQLAEEFRRAGQYQEAVDVCRAGLEIHPAYLSARVTLGRAFLELNQLDDAQSELELVLKSARENLAAIRGLAEIHHRRGALGEALTHYRAALALARNDPELQQTVTELSRKIEPAKPAHSAGGLSFEQARRELSLHAPLAEQKTIALPLAEPETIAPSLAEPEVALSLAEPEIALTLAEPENALSLAEPAINGLWLAEPETALSLIDPESIVLAAPPEPSTPLAPAPVAPPAWALAAPAVAALATSWPAEPVFSSAAAPAIVAAVDTPLSLPSRTESINNDSTRARAARTIVALELWLGAIHVARAHRRA